MVNIRYQIITLMKANISMRHRMANMYVKGTRKAKECNRPQCSDCNGSGRQ